MRKFMFAAPMVVILMFVTSVCPFPVFSGDYRKGFEAYQQGDYVTALVEFTALAKQENAFAQYNLGLMYEQGLGVPKDVAMATEWYIRAASQGKAEAQFRLGSAYHLGQGIAKDDVQAEVWLRRAANQGVTDAQVMLGEMLFLLRIPLHNNAPAYMWMSIAASSGDKAAKKKKRFFTIFMTPNQLVEGEKLIRKWKAQFEADVNTSSK